MQCCELFSHSLVNLDLMLSKIQLKQWNLKSGNMRELRQDKLNYLWSLAGMHAMESLHMQQIK
jgi:hypothetical protein